MAGVRRMGEKGGEMKVGGEVEMAVDGYELWNVSFQTRIWYRKMVAQIKEK